MAGGKSGYFREDTIAAILTAPNAISAVGMLRVSGPDAWKIVAPLLKKMKGGAFERESLHSHRLHHCLIHDNAGKLIDDGMFVWMENPNSFTGEEVVELHLHGNPHLLRRAMQAILHGGAAEALPGEFSFRAFRSGKISLDQAESISDLITSQSEESANRALGHLLGRAQPEISQLKQEIVNRLAEMEVDIDFSDQGLSTLDYEGWSSKLVRWNERVEKIRQEFLLSQPRREGIRLALVGAPNSGKSSLFNRLLGEDRSIVSMQAGTTRDVVREALNLKGLLFRLSDTAGIRATEDQIEAEGVDRSFGEVRVADAVLWIFDGVEEFAEQAKGLEKRWQALHSHVPKEARILAVWNKADQVDRPGPEWVRFLASKNITWVGVSAKTGYGLHDLIEKLTNFFAVSEAKQPDFLISRSRHYEVLGRAQEAVLAAVRKVEAGERFPDLLSSDLREALSRLGEITGEFSTEDLLSHIFSEFCIGK
ncbi:MAG: tRNA uridine-5-carboxymethylaminomethyl(34) synthesis GTPase MnmE [Bdellovibrionota bacterium]